MGRIIAEMFNEYTPSIFYPLIKNQRINCADIDFNP